MAVCKSKAKSKGKSKRKNKNKNNSNSNSNINNNSVDITWLIKQIVIFFNSLLFINSYLGNANKFSTIFMKINTTTSNIYVFFLIVINIDKL